MVYSCLRHYNCYGCEEIEAVKYNRFLHKHENEKQNLATLQGV